MAQSPDPESTEFVATPSASAATDAAYAKEAAGTLPPFPAGRAPDVAGGKPDLRTIKAVAFDIDGVMTDGSLIPLGDGDVLRIMNAKDAFAIRALTGKGLTTAVISGGCTEALRLRCISMKVREDNIYLKARGKMVLMQDFCGRNGIAPCEVAYFGDDIPDIPLLRACGAGFVPSDAVPEAVEAADFVLSLPGGRGAVREGVEMILKAQGKWVFEEDTHKNIF